MKVYKNYKTLQGAVIKTVTEADLINHYISIISDWTYLTKGTMPFQGSYEGEEKFTSYQRQIEERKKPMEKKSNEEVAQNFIEDYARNNGSIIDKDLLRKNLLKAMDKKEVDKTIGKLVGEGFIMEVDNESYTIC